MNHFFTHFDNAFSSSTADASWENFKRIFQRQIKSWWRDQHEFPSFDFINSQVTDSISTTLQRLELSLQTSDEDDYDANDCESDSDGWENRVIHHLPVG